MPWGRALRAPVPEAAAIFTVAVLARIPYLGHVPHRDELNHVLAARALQETGTLEIVPGADPYTRAEGFTYLVAGMFRLFGESLVVARLPALLAGALLVLLLFVWLRREVGPVGAWGAALLLAFSPISIQLSQWSRFYTLHALLVLLACLLVFRGTPPHTDRLREGGALWAAAVVSLLLAFHLQVTTLIAVAGILLWVAVVGVPAWIRRLKIPTRRVVAGAVVATAAIAGVVAMLGGGVTDYLSARAEYVDGWAEHRQDELYFYHYRLLHLYPPLWSLFPLALVIALATRFRAALLCACIFGVAFTAHSVAAWKAERYLFYALPFFFAIWGIAASAVYPWLRNRMHDLARQLGLGTSGLLRGGVVAVAIGAIVLFGAFSSPAAFLGFKMMTVGDADWQWAGYRGHPDWVGASRVVLGAVDEVDVVVASYDLTALYAVGRLDYMLRSAGAGRSDEGVVFGYRSKSAVPTIGSPGALEQVMECYRSGLVFVDGGHHGRSWAVDARMVDVLRQRATRLATPDPQIYVYQWQGGRGADADCAGVPGTG
jgi:4-amino-4-deoxy-L-arabinose transferase-like glycosyltransferase